MKNYITEIKERADLTSYLEYAIIYNDYKNYIKTKKACPTSENIISKNWYKCSTYFTRIWLNYLDNDQFNKVLNKKITESIPPQLTKSKKNIK